MKTKFIKFMKKQKAWNEYKVEIKKGGFKLERIFKKGAPDGYIITRVDWVYSAKGVDFWLARHILWMEELDDKRK